MSFLLDPPALFLFGVVLLLVKKKVGFGGQFARVLGALVIIIFVGVSSGLYLDWYEWPINIFDLTPPLFESIGGKEWMLHTDITGITAIPNFLAVVMFLLYPIWLLLGYEIARGIWDPHRLKILSGGPYTRNDVRSATRSKKPNEETLLSAVRKTDPKLAVKQAINNIGGIAKYVKSGDTVVIKPNICGGNPQIKGSFTTPEVLDEVVRLVKEVGGSPIIVDSDMVWTDFEPVAKAQGWIKWCQARNIPLYNLRKTECVKFDFESSSSLKVTAVSKLMMEADVIISVPTMKTHLMTSVTCGMKNMYGTLPTGEKSKYHKSGIEDAVVDINTGFQPTLTIVDGSIGGESIGPLSCNPVNSKTIIASNDVVAADAAAATIMGFDPMSEIIHLRRAHEQNLGKADLSFDWQQLENMPHPKDGKWIRPNPEVCAFYNKAIETIMIVPGAKNFMNSASDFLLYDSSTLPIFKNVTPAILGAMSDILGAVFGVLYRRPMRGKKLLFATKIEELWEIYNQHWPSDEFKNQLLMIGTDKKLEIDPPLVECIDETGNIDKLEENSKIAADFLPDVRLQGIELSSERDRKNFGGIMYRVLTNKLDSTEKCIEYIYVWLRQKWFLSWWYNLLIPTILAVMGLGIFSAAELENEFWTYTSIGTIVLVLILFSGAALIKTINHWRVYGDMAYRYHQISLIIYAIVFSMLFLELPSRYNMNTLIPSFEVAGYPIYIPIASLVLLLTLIFGPILIFQPWIPLFTHQMDYAPVFVYTKKNENDGKWGLDKVRYDKFHYQIATQEFTSNKVKKRSAPNNRTHFQIPNSWHSFELGTYKQKSNLIPFVALLGTIASVLVASVLLIVGLGTIRVMNYIPLISVVGFISAYIFSTRFTYNLLKIPKSLSLKQYLAQPDFMLTSAKLKLLWNLYGDEADFKIKQKLQDPFNNSSTFWKNFYNKGEESTYASSIEKITERNSNVFSVIFSLVMVIAAITSFVISGFWDRTIEFLNTHTNALPVYIFLFGFLICMIGLMIYTSHRNLSLIMVLGIISSLFALTDEYFMTTSNLWNYLDGEPISLIFAVFGWPIFIGLIFGVSDWILKYVRLPVFKNRIMNSIPVLLVILIALGLFYIEGFLDYLQTIDSMIMYGVIAVVVLSCLLALIYGFSSTFKQNLTLVIVSIFVGTFMELMGQASTFWTYFSFDTIISETIPVPIFLMVFWSIRILAIGAILLILRKRIIKYGYQ